MRALLLALITLSIFAGCSAKEFKEGAQGIGSDISNAFERAKDK